jgi:hypothetical protein
MEEQNKERHTGDWNWGWRRGRSPWMPGLLLILIGGFFLLRNFTGYQLENWWALFLLIPAVGNFSGAYESFRSSGFNRHTRNQLFWGFFFTLLSGSLLLAVDLGLIWPVFLILGGLGMLLGAL